MHWKLKDKIIKYLTFNIKKCNLYSKLNYLYSIYVRALPDLVTKLTWDKHDEHWCFARVCCGTHLVYVICCPTQVNSLTTLSSSSTHTPMMHSCIQLHWCHCRQCWISLKCTPSTFNYGSGIMIYYWTETSQKLHSSVWTKNNNIPVSWLQYA